MTDLNLNRAEFIRSAAAPKQFIRSPLPKVAFAGRSNVGKSSVINRIVNRKQFAKVGATPGKTVHVNYFEIDGKTVCIAEFETGSDTLKDLQKILCLASAVGKEIADIDFDLGDVLSVRTGDVTFPVKGGEMTLPVYSVREDIYNGMLNFAKRYPDIPFTNNMAKCIGSVEIPGDCDYKAVLIQGFRAYLLLEYKGQIIAFVYGFDEKKYLGMVKGKQMLSGIRGYER